MAGAVVAGVIAGAVAGSVAVGIAVAITAYAMQEMMKPDLPEIPEFRADFSPTGHLINTRSTDAPVNIVYGQTKVGGAQVYISTSGEDNKYLHIVQTISEGEIDSLVEVWLDDKLSTEYGNLVTYNFHNGSATQTYDTSLHSVDNNWVDCLRNTAYIYIRLEYDRDKFTGMPKILTVVKGRKVYDTRDGQTKWTDNPALCVYDFLTNTRYGMGIDSQFIDIQSISNTADWCDNKGYTFNGVINTRQPAIDNLTNMLASFKCSIIFTDGKFKLLPLQYDSPVMNLYENDIIADTFKKVVPTVQDLPNVLKVKWINPNNNYIYDDLIVYNKAQVDADGERIEKQLLLLGCNNITQARSVASYYLERMRLNKKYLFVAKTKVMPLEAGDMINLKFPSLGVDEQVRVESISPKSNDTYEIVVTKENPDMYNDKTDLVAHVSYSTNLPDGTEKPPTPQNLSLTTGTEANQQGLTTAYVIATWDAISDPKVIEYELKLRKDGSTDYTYVKVGASETSYKFSALEPNTKYYVAIRSINENNLVSNWSIEHSITTAYDMIPPSKVVGVVAESNYDTVYVRWSRNSEPDVAGYEVFASTTSGFACDDTTLKWRGSANHCSFYTDVATTWYIKVRAYDLTENRGECSDEVSVNTTELTAQSKPDGYNLVINSDFDDGLEGWEKLAGVDLEVVIASSPKTGKYAGQNSATTDVCEYYSATPIPIQKDRTFIGEAYFKTINGTNGNCFLGIILYDSNGNRIAGDTADIWKKLWEGRPSNTFEYHHLTFGWNTDNTFPSNATHMAIVFGLNEPDGTGNDSVFQVQGLRIREVIESAYIRDAAITTAKIADLAVDNAKINDVSGDKIHAGVIYDYYGNPGDYVVKFDLNEGALNIRDGVMAQNFIPNYKFDDGINYWTATAGHVETNDNTSLGFEHFYRLDITDDQNEHIETDHLEPVTKNEDTWISCYLRATPDTSIDDLADIRIYANYYDANKDYYDWEEIFVLDKRDWLEWKNFAVDLTIPDDDNIKYVQLGFETQGGDDKWNDGNLCDNPDFGTGDFTGWSVSDSSNTSVVACDDAPDSTWACDNQDYNVKMLVDGTSREVVDADFIDISGREGEDISASVNIICDNPSTTNAIELGIRFYDSNQNQIQESVLWTGAPSSWTAVCGWDDGCDENAIGTIPSGAVYAKVFIRAKSISTDSFYCYFSWLDISVEKHASGWWDISVVNYKHGWATADEVVLTSGDISFYKYRDDTGTPFKSLKKIESGYANNGEWVNLTGFYDRQPQVLLSPRTLQVYSSDDNNQNQTLKLYADELSGSFETGEWSFKAVAELIIAANTYHYDDVYNTSCNSYEIDPDYLYSITNSFEQIPLTFDSCHLYFKGTSKMRYQHWYYDSATSGAWQLRKSKYSYYHLHYKIQYYKDGNWYDERGWTKIGDFYALKTFIIDTNLNLPVGASKIRLRFRFQQYNTGSLDYGLGTYECNTEIIYDGWDYGHSYDWELQHNDDYIEFKLEADQKLADGSLNWIAIG